MALPATLPAVLCALSLGGCASVGERVDERREPFRPDPSAAASETMASETMERVSGDVIEATVLTLPRTDLDDDGVEDDRDDCPDTRENEVVDAVGCALFSGVLEGVVFAPSDHRLGAASREALLTLVSDLRRHPDVKLRLEGHTDNRGTAAVNLELSKRRVMSVARFLVSNGIAPARLRPHGYGESRPLAGNATESGRERNRRIEIDTWYPPVSLAEPGGTGQNAGDAE